MTELIHFAHGNGFPSLCYRQILQPLGTQYTCYYIDKIGHNSDYPVTDNWQYLVHELIVSIERQADRPVIAVGHSLGGVLSWLASVERPALFKQVILLDSPLMGRLKSNMICLLKSMGWIDHITPARRTRFRRQHWQTRAHVLAYLRKKSLFQHFTEACLNDYIEYGLEQAEDGTYSLRFNSEIEYRIYRTIPHVLHQYEGRATVPTSIIYGTESDVINRSDLAYMKNKHGISSYPMTGSHMFPMEYPEGTADLIVKIIHSQSGKNRV